MTSVLSWTWYVVAVSLLLAAGGVVLELALRAFGRAGRWSWALTLLALLVVPASTLLPRSEALPELPPVALDVIGAPLLLLPEIPPRAAATAPRIDPAALIPWLWAAASLLVLLLVLLSYLALRRAARSWRSVDLGGVRVLVSACTGPAVVGVRRPRIVVPEWVLELGEGERRLMILHEQEHMRARDPALLLSGIAVCVLLPWNPVAWWALHRLRIALELDCDARVLSRGSDPGSYGTLLLEVGRRRSGRLALAAAFAEPRVLERRVRALLRWPSQRRPLLAVVCGLAALLFFGAACVAPTPLAGPTQVAPGAQATTPPIVTDTSPSVDAGPIFTPFTAPPELQNRDEVSRTLLAEYPPLLNDAGIGGTSIVWVFIDRSGRVMRTLVKTSSGYTALDSAALRVAAVMSFKPAENRGAVVPVWVQLPIRFVSDRAVKTVPPPKDTTPQRSDELDRAPTFTPFTLAPELLNRQDVARRLDTEYPSVLRDKAIGGTTRAWLFIDQTGRVTRTMVKVSSGYPALDEAALRVANGMSFRPAQNRDVPVPVWIEIPIMFSSGPDTPRTAGPDVRTQLSRLLSSMEVRGPANGPLTFGGDFATGGGHIAYTMDSGQPLNPSDVLLQLVRAYTTELRAAGKQGRTVLRAWRAEDGTLSKQQIVSNSGQPELDGAAILALTTLRFRPQQDAAWVQVIVDFTAGK